MFFVFKEVSSSISFLRVFLLYQVSGLECLLGVYGVFDFLFFALDVLFV